MNEQTQNSVPTFESVWAVLQETGRLQKENERILKEIFAETKQQMKETKQQMKESKQQMKETKQQMKESKQQMKESKEKAEKNQEDFERRWKKYEQRMANMETRVGAWSYNHGCFAEEYFFNSFENDQQNFFGEKFDEIRKHVHPKESGLEDEYDMVLYNGTSVAIIEVKYKAHENDIPKVLKKAETFRILCQGYKDCKIYLGLASMVFYPLLEQKCIDEGIAIIKQVGDTMIIEDGHLKVFLEG